MDFDAPYKRDDPEGRVGVLTCRDATSADEIAERAILVRDTENKLSRTGQELIIVIHFNPQLVNSESIRSALSGRNNGFAEFDLSSLDDDDRTLYWLANALQP